MRESQMSRGARFGREKVRCGVVVGAFMQGALRLLLTLLNSLGKSCNMLDQSAINLRLVFFRKPNLNVTFLD